MELSDIQQAILNCFPMPSERNLDGMACEPQIVKSLNGNRVRIRTVLNDLEYMGYVKKVTVSRGGNCYVKIPRHLTNENSQTIILADGTTATVTLSSQTISKDKYLKTLQEQNKQIHGQMDKIEDKYLKAKKELEEKKKVIAEKTAHIDLLMVEVDYWKELLDKQVEKNLE